MVKRSHVTKLRLSLTAPRSLSFGALLSCGLCLTFIFSFVYPATPLSPLAAALQRAQRTPFDPRLHTQLAYIYREMGNQSGALRELALAEASTPAPGVLGAANEIHALKKFFTTQPETERKLREYWEKVVATHPTYRDAWVQLLYLSYNAGDKFGALVALDHIRTLDPNYINLLPDIFQSL